MRAASSSAVLKPSVEEEIAQEWEVLAETVREAFRAIKVAKDALWHESNVEAAKEFATVVNAAWNEAKRKGGK